MARCVFDIYNCVGGDVMPIDSWQFWTVTLLALMAVVVLLRPFFPRWKSKESCCSSATKPKKTKLTISSKSKP